ncbi:ABC transporter permease [Paenibacillus sp. JDR-2]|uniref:ABC transporter permease n=1 Tax=Paenibacillus sp. (strain JDR-2) TaxID=324057 RepID=UPI000166ADB4|nr:ABC transporter permease subunit [Paenibacillus sp. JDR-2]ACT04762.1 binding-protein-dependent transport systems inner membrane component [Paenibacillus sp. JDR-2]
MHSNGMLANMRRRWQLYVLLLPSVLYILLFHYVPMYGIIIAFKDFKSSMGIIGSPWVGMKHFEAFFDSFVFEQIVTNTVKLSAFSLLIGFPIPILFALLLNQIRNRLAQRFVQTVTYAPYFISTVVLVSMLNVFLAPSTGIINNFITLFGGEAVNFMAREEWFRTVYISSGIWQTMGFSAIIYLAALSGVNPELHEAATVDGATKLRRIWNVDLPSILPTITILFILGIGSIMSVGWEKAFLMQQGMNLPVSEIISTYVYKVGLLNAQYSFATAIGLFNSIINFTLLIFTNYASRKMSGNSLW